MSLNPTSKKQSLKKVDFKKLYKEFYLPKTTPSIVKLPSINYLAVRGKGDPNRKDGEYQVSIELLYTIAFTIKMSYKSDHKIPGYFEYVVPPLEGLWWQDGYQNAIGYHNKANFNFISLIRLPDFVTREDFNWVISTATQKKQRDFSKVEFLPYDEGLCVQCMHIGSYDDEPKTIAILHAYLSKNNYELDIQNPRYHHEIYLSNPRRQAASKLKTVIRLPIKPTSITP